jgi:streptogramin lyase
VRSDLALGQRGLSWRALRAAACAGLAAVAGLALGPAAGAGAVTLGPGDIVVLDAEAFGFTGGVIRVDPVSGAQTTVTSGGSFVIPRGLALEADNDILVVDPEAFGGPGGVIRIDPVSGAQTTVSSGGSFVNPAAIAVEPDGNIVISDAGAFGGTPGAVIRVDPLSGAQTTVSSGGSFESLGGVALEADGDILLASSGLGSGGPSSVIRVDPVSGAQTAVTSGGALVDPRAVALEADGDILVADQLAHAVIRVDPVSGAQTTVSSGGSFVSPIALALEADGDIVVADAAAFNGRGAVFRVDPVSGAQTTVSTDGSIRGPNGIAVVNALPVANDDAYTTAQDAPLRVAAPGVLGNDSDADGEALTAARVSGPADGTLTLNADGAFTYTPAAGFHGRDSFTYRASDGTADSNTATVTITVNPAVTPPSPPPPPPPRPSPTAVMRLRAPDLSVFGRSGSQARCRMRIGRIRTCSVRLRLGRRVLARGRAASTQAGRRSLTVTLELTGSGRALLARRLGGVRVRIHARGATTGGTRTATARTRALLRVEHFRTPAGSWIPNQADPTARGRRFVRSLRGKLIAVARLRCDGHDANVRATSHTTSRLSLARAALFCDALRRLGIRSQPTLAGHGDSQPIASNAARSGRAQNRRVEVTITHRARRP